MKVKNIGICLILLIVLFAANTVQAQIVTFNDDSIYWPGWKNSTSDDTKDSIGIPNFTGGQANIIDEQLESLTFDRQTGSDPHWWVITPGDLFIDIGANQTWDYAVDLSTWVTAGKSNSDPLAGNYNLYAIDLALNSDSGYILSGKDNSGDWSGFLIRQDHPVALKDIPDAVVDTVYFSGWGDGTVTQYIFDFNSLDLGESGQFTVGWMPNCANDVIYETLDYTVTPEPMTLLLFGTGLAGAFFRRKIG